MDPILLFITILLIFGVIVFTPLNTIILRFLYKNERISPSSSTAQNNVTLFNEYNGVKYAPISIEPIGDENEYIIRVESREAPFREAVLTVIPDQFKHDPIEVCQTGMPYYRIIRRELVGRSKDDTEKIESDPTYSKEELNIISEDAFKEKIRLEGEIMNLKANKEETVDDAIERAQQLASAGKGQ